MIAFTHIKSAEELAAEALNDKAKEVRAERDRLLLLTDYTMLADSPVADQGAWMDYREALRDMPEQEWFPNDPEWPTPPDFKRTM